MPLRPARPARPGHLRRPDTLKLTSTTRYVQTARLVIRLPTYARVVWGIERDRRTPLALKALLAAAWPTSSSRSTSFPT